MPNLASKILCVGDIADGQGDFKRCVGLLKASSVDCVLGNHDRWLLKGTMRDLPEAVPFVSLEARERSFLAGLPKTRAYSAPRGRLLLCHGMGEDDMGGLLSYDEGYALESNFELQEILAGGRYGWVVAGHTHEAMVRRIGRTWFVNPGTLRRDHGACSAVLDLERLEARLLCVEPSVVGVRDCVSLD